MTSAVQSRNARTGETTPLPAIETSAGEVAAAAQRACNAVRWLRDLGVPGRTKLLNRIADALEAQRDSLVDLADAETALGPARLTGEVARTAWQLRFLADVVTDGAYLTLTVDHATEGPLGPQPDLRKMLMPLGPIAVFGASNFPFAFSTIGGDSASALAVGCPVLFKAHPGHPRTALAVDELVRHEIAAAGGPEGVFCTVFGWEAGIALVDCPQVAGVGFTGSLSGGRVLYERAVRRDNPIPFFGELGSLNPVVVTESGAAERAAEIGAGIAGSLLLGAGQFCTKPGLVLLPSGAHGDTVIAALAEAVVESRSGPLLTESIQARFTEQVQQTCTGSSTSLLAQAALGTTRGLVVETHAAAVLSDPTTGVLEEHFGPFCVVIRYRDEAERDRVLEMIPPALTGTVQSATADDDALASIVEILAARSGRVVVNQYPTGVAVTWAMHHGGPYPASTNAAHTSVGAASIQRWLRPVTYQNAPSDSLPPELRDGALDETTHRLNGVLRPAGPTTSEPKDLT